jgi:chromosome segregation protein
VTPTFFVNGQRFEGGQPLEVFAAAIAKATPTSPQAGQGLRGARAVQFQRLRLQGFKSFVEPTEFRIEPGLTGIVGPNGCGKSNLLEALRWVMGANSAKAMRAGGMDDVIFAGSGNRPARNHADVTLTIDNADRTAPAQFNDDPVLEVVRRIDRGEGSTYRINGREVRARDVQLLFADASTGANSPALVRQGQISELIGAKPQNRRRILEEAAGVSGLHTRRHEAELRLRAAEANLSRLEDVARELETALNRLRARPRQAEKYKRLSAEIRAVQGAVLYARWTEARDTLNRTQSEATEAARAVEDTARAAAAAQTAILAAETAMPPLREEASIAQAILGQLAIQKDRAERESEAAAAEFERLSADLARIDDDRAREAQGLQDAVQALARADAELTELRAQIAAAPARGPELAAAAKAAEDARAKADAEVEQLAARAAAEDARARAAAQRLAEAESRLARTVRALDQAKVRARRRRSRGRSGRRRGPPALRQRRGGPRVARQALEEAEAVRVKTAAAEAQSRDLARKVEDQLGRLRTEARGLAQLTAPRAKSGFSPALDAVTPEKGYGAALAAALGDDLEAALDPRAASFWAGRRRHAVAWPDGADAAGPADQGPAGTGRPPVARGRGRAGRRRPPGQGPARRRAAGLEGRRPVALGRLHGPRRRPQARRRAPGAAHPPGRGRGRDRPGRPARRGRDRRPEDRRRRPAGRRRKPCGTSGAVRPRPSAC